MILYDYFRSSAAFRVRIALNLKGLTADRRFIHLAKYEQNARSYMAVNPQGLVPLLIDGSNTISQSLAIIEYLNELHPEPPLLPADIGERAFVRSLAQIIACDIHPINNLRVLDYLSKELKVSDAQKNAWYGRWIADGFTAMETILTSRSSNGLFCLGNTPTLADICLVPQVTNANRFKCPLEPFPRIQEIYHNCMKLSAFNDAQPSKQGDAGA